MEIGDDDHITKEQLPQIGADPRCPASVFRACQWQRQLFKDCRDNWGLVASIGMCILLLARPAQELRDKDID